MRSLSNSEKQCAIQLIHPPLFGERCVYCMSAAVISAVFCFWYVRYFILPNIKQRRMPQRIHVYKSTGCESAHRTLIIVWKREICIQYLRQTSSVIVICFSIFYQSFYNNVLSSGGVFVRFFFLFLTIITDKNFMIWCVTRNLFAEKR